MHILVGTEGGQLKSIPYYFKSDPSPHHSVLRKSSLIVGTENAEKLHSESANAQIVSFGSISKSSCIKQISVVQLCGRDLVLIGRSNGNVDIWDHALSGNHQELSPLLVSIPVFDLSVSTDHCDKRKITDIVGLDFLSWDTFFVINRNGNFKAITIQLILASNEMETDVIEVRSIISFEFGGQIERVRSCNLHPHLLAMGGKDLDLIIFDLNNQPVSSSNGKNSQALETSITNKKKRPSSPLFQGLGNVPTCWNNQGQCSPTPLVPVWVAKNLPNDSLNLKIPVWITDLRFMNELGTLLVTCSNYHDVKVYDTSVSRRPIGLVYVGSYPLRSLCPISTRLNDILVSDSKGTIFHISLTKAIADYESASRARFSPEHPRNRSTCTKLHRRKVTESAILGLFKGAQGAIKQMIVFDRVVVGVGLDRFVRIWDLKSRRLLCRYFGKQRLDSVALWVKPIANYLPLSVECVQDNRSSVKELLEADNSGDDEEKLWRDLNALESAYDQHAAEDDCVDIGHNSVRSDHIVQPDKKRRKTVTSSIPKLKYSQV